MGTFSALNVHRGTPSHRPPKSQSGSARPASRSSKADSPLSFTPLNHPILPSFLLQQAEDRLSLSYFNVHYSGQAPCPVCGSWLSVALSLKTGVMWLKGGGSVCICFCAFATPVDRLFLAHSTLSLSHGVIGICNEADFCVAKCLAGQEVKVSETLQLLEWRCCWNSLLACNECSRFVQENIFFEKP